ncbi:MAG: hypothetical protein JKY52_00245 [Flavobacteriales bacterium]|nr:hypothetical protein [Flavobacteriales bacterium]
MAISQEVFAYWRKHGAPGVTTSEREAFVSQANGKTYTCSKKYEADIKAQGYEIVGDAAVETADDKPSADYVAKLDSDIRTAYNNHEGDT